MLKFKQYFCRHEFEKIAQHKDTQMNLWRCNKCEVFLVQHYGIGLSYKCKIPNILHGWDTTLWKL
jgi:hypothetical protein